MAKDVQKLDVDQRQVFYVVLQYSRDLHKMTDNQLSKRWGSAFSGARWCWNGKINIDQNNCKVDDNDVTWWR
jgi:hypothetical protein